MLQPSPLWEKYRDPSPVQDLDLNTDALRNIDSLVQQPLIKQVNLDLSFARIGTLAMVLRSIISGIFGSSRDNDPETTESKGLDIFDDFLHKFRQQAQYSIHAQPGGDSRKPDDIASDKVENMVAASLGNNVYKLNAFVAPWLALFKVFFPYNDNPVWGLVPRLVDFVDNTTGKLTNIFWNLRRVGKAFVAYDGGITTDAFKRKQNEVREVISYYTNRFLLNPKFKLIRPVMKLWRKLFSTNPSAHIEAVDTSERKSQEIKALTQEMKQNFWNNFKAIWSSNYSCAHQGGIPKEVGIEEPENQKWYVRSKIASKCLGLPAGIIGGLLNGSSIGLNFLGSFFNIRSLRDLAGKATDIANGLMSLVYLTGEVPANLNEYIKKGIEGDDPNRKRNLAVFTIGLLGMLNRVKILPGVSRMLQVLRIKPLLDHWDKALRHFFLFFFSYNRLVLHSDEKNKHEHTAAVRDIMDSEKHDNLGAHLLLPFRVLFNDEQVTHRAEPKQLLT